MTPPEQSPQEDNSYVLETESATEMARLMLQDRLLNETMGGLFPERTNLDSIDSILDIGCGPGGWALDVARSYPKKKITGVDVSAMMLTYANEQKKIHKLTNIQFQKMDVRQALDFPDQSFDLVNIRAATGYVSRSLWPQLLKECARITKAGGTLRLSESDRIALTNSTAFEQYAYYFTHLMSTIEYGFGVDTHTLGMSPMLGKLLQDAGYHDIQTKSHVLDFSYGTTFYSTQLQNIDIMFQSLHPRFMQMGIATQKELENLHETLVQEMRSTTFCGIGYIFTFWGKL